MQGGTNRWADIVGGITEGLSNSYFVTLREKNKIVLFTFLQLQRHKILYQLHCYLYRGIKIELVNLLPIYYTNGK
jgi:hypothetical protein